MRFKTSFIFLLLTSCLTTLFAQPLQRVKPEEVNLNSLKLKSADSAIYAAIRKGQIPGAVLAVVRHGKLAYLKAYGYKQTFPSRKPMTENTIFDLASLTKPLATAISAMILVERGQLDLNDSVSKYIPDYRNWTYPSGVTRSIKIKDLMTHTSGLPAYAPYERLRVSLGSPNPEGFMKYISGVNRLYAPETDFTYSCLNFITLQHVIERITKQSLRDFTQQNIYDVLGMKYTDFKPSEELLPWVAPTERTKEGVLLRGVVQDPLARWMRRYIGQCGTVLQCFRYCHFGGCLTKRRSVERPTYPDRRKREKNENRPARVVRIRSCIGMGCSIGVCFHKRRFLKS